MTRLRFTRPWSTYRAGDTMETGSPVTVERLVRMHGVCVVESAVTLSSPLADGVKALDASPADKMIRAAGKAKMRRIAPAEPK